MIDFDGIRSQADLVQIVRSFGVDLERKGEDYFACCPFHQDDTPSFTVFRDPKTNTQRFKCFGCPASGDVFDFVRLREGLQSPKQQADRVRELIGLPGFESAKPASSAESAQPASSAKKPPKRKTKRGKKLGEWFYYSADSLIVLRVEKFETLWADTGERVVDEHGHAKKDFWASRPDPGPRPEPGGKWAYNITGVTRPLYRLPEVLQAEIVWICEGERDADNMVSMLGVCATTNQGGARAKWESQYTEALRGKTVYIVPDNDDPGKERGYTIAHLLHGVAAAVFLVELPGGELGIKDATDFIDAGQKLEDFLSFAKLYEPAPEQPALEQPALQQKRNLIEFPASGDGNGSNNGHSHNGHNGNGHSHNGHNGNGHSHNGHNGNGNGNGNHHNSSSLPPDPNWRDLLIRNRYNNPQPWLSNVLIALRHAPEWHSTIWFNEFSQAATARKSFPGIDLTTDTAWTDRHDTLLAEWLQQQAGIAVGTDVVGRAVQCVAEERKYHPVREYLDSLRWDSTGRIDTWLSDYMHVQPSNYSAAVGARWLISAVARVFEPGVKADCCLILEGEQGIRKSTALRVLAVHDDWFADRISDLGSKDSSIEAAGVWIVEFSELDTIKRNAEWSRVKGYISATFDRYRPPYGKRAMMIPRQCIFAGTVNHETYFGDETGSRRFWPVRCLSIGVEQLKEDRDQLWAEAVVRYRDGERWWLDDRALVLEAEEEQSARFEADPWQERIDAWLELKDTVSIAQVLEHCIQKPTKDWTQQDRNRVAKCLRAARWNSHNTRNEDGTRERKYKRGPMAKRQVEMAF